MLKLYTKSSLPAGFLDFLLYLFLAALIATMYVLLLFLAPVAFGFCNDQLALATGGQYAKEVVSDGTLQVGSRQFALDLSHFLIFTI